MFEFMDCVVYLWQNGRETYVLWSLIGMAICIFLCGMIVGDALCDYMNKRDRYFKGTSYTPDSRDMWIAGHFSNDELGELRRQFDKLQLPNDEYIKYLAYVAVRTGRISKA